MERCVVIVDINIIKKKNVTIINNTSMFVRTMNILLYDSICPHIK